MLGELIDSKYEYRLYLLHPGTKEITACIDLYSELSLKRTFNSIDELTLTIPLKNNDVYPQTENYVFNLINPNSLIQMDITINDEIINQQIFYVSLAELNGGEKEEKRITAYSSEYKLGRLKILKFTGVTKLWDNVNAWDSTDTTKSGILNYILEEKLQNTWEVEYMSPSFLNIYRTFDISSKSIIECIKEIETKFNCVIIFDSFTHKIYIKTYEEVGENKGLVLSYNLIKSINKKIKIDEITTRLYCYGNNNTQINAVNITGLSYLDDFRFFRTKDFMSQSLLDALTSYDALLATKNPTFNAYLLQLETLRAEYDDLYNDPTTGMDKLQNDLVIIQDNEDVCIKTSAPVGGQSYSYWYSQEQTKKTEISNKQIQINSKQSQINTVLNNIKILGNEVSYQNNFTTSQLQELLDFINEDTVQCSMDDEKEILLYGQGILNYRATPPIEFSIDVADFIDCVEYQHQWRMLELGDIINIDFDILNISNAETRLISYTHSPTSNSLTLEFSSRNSLNTSEAYWADIFVKSKQTSDTVETERETYKDYQNDKETINDFITSPIDSSSNNVILGDGSIIDRRGLFMRQIEDSQGQMRVLTDKIVMSSDNWQSFSTAITSDGIYCSSLWVLTNTDGSVQINGNRITATDMDFLLTRGNNEIYMNPSDGFKIRKNGSNVFWVDTNGNVNMSGILNASQIIGSTITGGSMIIGSGTSVYKVDNNGLYLGNETFANAPFRVTPQGDLTANSAVITGEINATSGTFSGNITSTGTISGGTISGATISGGTINVTTDVSIGNKLIINPANFDAGIDFGNANIYADPGGGALTLSASTLTLSGDTIFSGTVSGIEASTQENHNHGIPNGTRLLATDGTNTYTVTFVSSGGHTHIIS